MSTGFAKKLLQQRRQRRDITPQHARSWGKPMLLESHPQLLSMLISRKPDIILAKMRSALDANCSLLEIPYILVANGPQAACYR